MANVVGQIEFNEPLVDFNHPGLDFNGYRLDRRNQHQWSVDNFGFAVQHQGIPVSRESAGGWLR